MQDYYITCSHVTGSLKPVKVRMKYLLKIGDYLIILTHRAIAFLQSRLKSAMYYQRGTATTMS